MRTPTRFAHLLPVALCLILFACGNAGGPSVPVDSVQPPVPSPTIASGLRLGSAFALYLDANGNVYGRGRNVGGVLGPGAADCAVFIQVTSSDNATIKFTRISAGAGHVLALNSSGQVYAWGTNDDSELGRTGPSSSVPVAVSGIPRPVVDVYAGQGTSFAVLDNGALWAWGKNGYGELGLGHIASPQEVPAPVPGISGVRQVSPGQSFTLVVLDNGALYGMGYNGVGQLGLVDRNMRTSPTRINTGQAVVRSAAAGADMSAYVTSDDRLFVMGDNSNGIVGDGVPIRASCSFPPCR